MSDARSGGPLQRYLHILEAAAAFPSGLNLAEIAAVVELPKSSVHRLISGLVGAHALEPSRERPGAYVLGKRVLRMLYLGAPGEWLEPLIRPALSDLAEATGLCAFVAKLADDSIRSIATVAPETAAVRTYVVPGRRIWPHAGATAKVILAFQPREVHRRILPSPLPRLTDRTITSRTAFAKELAQVRRTELGTCASEDNPGFGALACPIHLPEAGVIYSVAVTGPTEVVFNANQEHTIRELRKCATRLGHTIEMRHAQASSKPTPTDRAGAPRRSIAEKRRR